MRYGSVSLEEATNVLGTMESTSGFVPQPFKTMKNNPHIRHRTALFNEISSDVLTAGASGAARGACFDPVVQSCFKHRQLNAFDIH